MKAHIVVNHGDALEAHNKCVDQREDPDY